MTTKLHGLSAATSLLAALLAQSSNAATPRPAPCPMIGATYVARASASTKDRSYRLKIELLPRGAEGAAVATLWRIQMLAGDGGRLSELRMNYGCANGRGPCAVSPPSRPGADGGFYSEVIQLDRDFSLSAGDRAPYAIITPGFGQSDWTFTRQDMAMPDLTFFTPARATPDLQDSQVWLLETCGANASRKP